MATYNIEIREFNGVDYDILYPITTIENVNGLTTQLSLMSANTDSVRQGMNRNQYSITQLQTSISEINTSIQQIGNNIDLLNEDMTNIQDNISDLDEDKQDKADLGSLAFKDKITLNNSADTTGVLPTESGGTGNANGTIDKLTTPRTFRTNLESTSTASFDGSANATPGVTGILPTTNGGTGNANGTIDKLTTARTFRTNLSSTSTASFDGSANATPGVTGILPVSHGGTGASSQSSALANLGITISNTPITEGSTLAAGTIYIYYE